MSENLQKINNVSVSHILKTLTSSMKSRRYTDQEIALVQKEFLKQFGIEVDETFLKTEELDIQEKKKSVDFEKIEKWIESIDETRICVMMIWKEALKRNGKPSKAQAIKISHIMEEFSEWKRINPYRDKKYGTQRGWERDLTG